MDSDIRCENATKGSGIPVARTLGTANITQTAERVAKEKAAIDEILDWIRELVITNQDVLLALGEKLRPVSRSVDSAESTPSDNPPHLGTSAVYERLYEIVMALNNNNTLVRVLRNNLEI